MLDNGRPKLSEKNNRLANDTVFGIFVAHIHTHALVWARARGTHMTMLTILMPSNEFRDIPSEMAHSMRKKQE